MGENADNPVQKSGYSDLDMEKTLAGDDLASLPSFDDGSGQAVVLIPTGGAPIDLDDSAKPEAQADAAKTAKAAETLPRARKEPQGGEDSGEQPEGAEQTPDSAGIYGVFLKCLDFSLTVVHRPFGWIPKHARPRVGIAAIVTIGMSGLAVAAKVYFFPDNWMQVAAARENPPAASKSNAETSGEATGEQP